MKCNEILRMNSKTWLLSVDALNDPVMSSLLMSGKKRLTNSGVYGGAMTSSTCNRRLLSIAAYVQ